MAGKIDEYVGWFMMKNTWRISIGVWTLVWMLSGSGSAWGQITEPELSGAAELAGALIQNHSYLFASVDQTRLDQLNRRLREFRNQAQKTSSGQEAAAIMNQAADAIQSLYAILEKAPFRMVITPGAHALTLPPDKPVELPGDVGALLFQIQLGEGPVRCQTLDLDFAEKSAIDIETEATGIHWVLVSLTNVPAKLTTVPVNIRRGPEPRIRFYVQVQTPAFGRLKMEILSDETGKPVPAMVRLVWKTDGRDRRPGNAIEIAPQMDNQGQPSGRRRAQLPGRLAGPYWCVPKPFDMTLPPGEWEVTIRRGVEHIPIFQTISVAAGQVSEFTFQPRRWVDMRRLGWYSGDDHVHCQILNDGDAGRLMAWVQAEDIHLANVVKMGDLYRTWFEQRGWGPDNRVIEGDYVLSPGQECPRTHNELGHTIHMNTKEMVRYTSQYYLYDTVFDAVHAQGGLSGYCHVLFNMFQVHRDMSINIPKGKTDFVEVMQFAQMGTDLFYDFLNLGFKMTASAGSDVPWGGTVGEVRVYAFLGEIPFTPDAWFEAVRRGRTFVTNGPMIDFRVNAAYPGDEIAGNPQHPLRVRARVWGHPDRMVPTELEIVSQGEVIRKLESQDPLRQELSLEFEMPAGNGFWIAARAKGSDGSLAHTTPIYVTRGNLRFWKYENVNELIAKRMASLDEVENLVNQAREDLKQGKNPDNRETRQLAEQGPALLERVNEARRIYENLLRLAQEEQSARAPS